MDGQGVTQSSLMYQFISWSSNKRKEIITLSEPEVSYSVVEENTSQNTVFLEDTKCYKCAVSKRALDELAKIGEFVAIIVLIPFFIIGEIYRLFKGSIQLSRFIGNILTMPIHIIVSAFWIVIDAAIVINGLVRSIATGTGFLAWHGVEKLVSLIRGTPNTVLSSNPAFRDIVYHALGITLLAAALVFVPCPAVQLLALPIIMGSIYGTINDYFAVRDCPEYYTMGHYYDGDSLRGHAVKTNSLWVKPLVAGCYATVFVTKYAGIILALAGVLPFAVATFPVWMAAAMVAGSCVLGLLAAHLVSTRAKNSLETQFKEYAKLIEMDWDTAREKTWVDLKKEQVQLKEQKSASMDTEAYEKFQRRLLELTALIDRDAEYYENEHYARHGHLPIKHIIGWRANEARNGTGYAFAGIGTLLITIAIILLRIFAL